MNPIKQTILHDPTSGNHGNCLSAVLASLLHINIEAIPVFKEDSWLKDLNAWLRQFGLAYLSFPDSGFHTTLDHFGIQGMHHEIGGTTNRFTDVGHSCVAEDGQLVFDPHPSDDGLNTGVESHGIFVALRPWHLTAMQAEIDELRSALATLKAQQPVATVDCGETGDYFTEWFAELLPNAHQIGNIKVGTKLFLAAGAQPYKDSTPALSVGDSSFESWFESYFMEFEANTKQLCRDAYAAGLGDPLVVAVGTQSVKAPNEANLSTAPNCLNINDKAFWVTGWNECRDAMLAAVKGAA